MKRLWILALCALLFCGCAGPVEQAATVTPEITAPASTPSAVPDPSPSASAPGTAAELSAPSAPPALTPGPSATAKATAAPTAKATATPKPTATPTPKPTATPTPKPTATLTAEPTQTPEPDPTSTPEQGASSGSLGEQILELTNAERKAAGQSSLKYTSILKDAAKIRARECAEIGDVQHIRPDGSSYSTVAAETGVTFRELGENLFMSTGDNPVTARDAVDAWMNSSGHRENILRSGYTHMCVAAVQSGDTIYIVQLFGSGLSN